MSMDGNNEWDPGPAQNYEALVNFLASLRRAGSEIMELMKLVFLKAGSQAIRGLMEFFSKLTRMDFILCGLSFAALGVASLVVLAGFGVIGVQSFQWLQSGEWPAFPLLVAFNYLFAGTALQAWFAQPESWFGLHQVMSWALENIPLSLALIVDGALGMGFMAGVIALIIGIRIYRGKKWGGA